MTSLFLDREAEITLTDTVTPEQRSRMMSLVRSGGTKPEMRVRRFLHGRGFRYRLHAKEMAGKPDLTLPKYRTVVFVHGCFWHQHNCCKGTVPDTNSSFWKAKLARNVERDLATASQLESEGWEVVVVWECETQDEATLENVLSRLLERRE